MDLGLGSKRAGPGAAHCFYPHEALYCPAQGGTHCTSTTSDNHLEHFILVPNTTDPPPNWSCWMMVHHSPQHLQTPSHLSHAQCEPAVLYEENRLPLSDLTILVCSMLIEVLSAGSRLWASFLPLMESVSGHRLLMVILQGSCSFLT